MEEDYQRKYLRLVEQFTVRSQGRTRVVAGVIRCKLEAVGYRYVGHGGFQRLAQTLEQQHE